MSQPIFFLVPFGIGLVLGVVHFVGLWHTVKHLPDLRYPSVFLFGSSLLRISFLLTGFTLLMNGRWERISATLLGFLIAREVIVRRLARNV
jgi:F1F0 ATPase subunit 2